MTPNMVLPRMRPAVKARHNAKDKGAIAQLGERYTGSVEVSGSIPLSSTIQSERIDEDRYIICPLRLEA